MTDAHQRVADALAEVADALASVRLACLAAERLTRKTMRKGAPDPSVLRAHPVVNEKRPLDAALVRLERARHEIVVAMFAAALQDGMTIGELARNHGFSRQLASRYAKEARASTTTDHFG
jgi:hypothetical protein